MAATLSRTRRDIRNSLPLWQSAIASIVLAALVGAISYGIARAAGTLPHSVLVSTPAGDEPITLAPTIIMSAQGALAASLVYALLRRFARQADRILWIVGVIVILLSMIPIFGIDDPPARMVVTLVLMHIVVGVATLAALTGLTAPRRSA